MSSKKVSIGELASSVNDVLMEYKDLVTDDMKESIKKAGKTVKEEINSSAPVRTGKYAKSWTSKVTSEDSQSMVVTVYSPSRYMLAHLLEHGHAKRGGGRVEGIPHIAPAEEKGISQLESDIKTALSR